MLSTGYRTVSSPCLRCQFLSVIFQRRPCSPAPCLSRARRSDRRGLHVTRRQCQKADAEGGDVAYQPLSSHEDDIGRSEYPDDDGRKDESDLGSEEHQDGLRSIDNLFDDLGDFGRGPISVHSLRGTIGKPRQRQHQTSTTLQLTAMGKPFGVTIMHDIADGREERRAVDLRGRDSFSKENQATTTAATLEEAPTEKEVQDSIEALRPSTTILEADELMALANELSKGYNTKQLSLYLTATLRIDEIDADSVHMKPPPLGERKGSLKRSLWQVGRSPITSRVPAGYEIQTKRGGRSKKVVVQQVLRLAWALHSADELQSVGELELSLTSWQFAYLFALTGPTGEPLHQSMITIPLLRKTAEIRPYEPDNIMRIVARKGDAEQIAEQIDLGLRGISSLYTDLTKFKPLFEPDMFHTQLESIFSAALRADIGRRTSTVVELADKTNLIIHGNEKEAVHLARRALLRYLDLPSPHTFETYELILPGCHYSPNKVFGLEHDTSKLDVRHRNLILGREVMQRPVSLVLGDTVMSLSRHWARSIVMGDAVTATVSGQHQFQNGKHLGKYLSELPPFIPFKGRPTGSERHLWEPLLPLEPAPWRVELSRRLNAQSPGVYHESHADGMSITQPEMSVMQTFIPNQSRLLSYFAPMVESVPDNGIMTRKHARASFIPSPFGKYGVDAVRRLPRIEIVFEATDSGEPKRPMYILAKLSRQELRVCLPGEATDVCFVRDLTMKGIIGMAKEIGLGPFIAETERASTEHRSLEYCDVIEMQLPAWLISPDWEVSHDAKDHVQVPYLFDGFETVQDAHFRLYTNEELVHGAVYARTKLNSTERDIILHYSETDAGPFGGRRSETSLTRHFLGVTRGPTAPESLEKRTTQIVKAGLRIARVLTRLGLGALRARWEAADKKDTPSHRGNRPWENPERTAVLRSNVRTRMRRTVRQAVKTMAPRLTRSGKVLRRGIRFREGGTLLRQPAKIGAPGEATGKSRRFRRLSRGQAK